MVSTFSKSQRVFSRLLSSSTSVFNDTEHTYLENTHDSEIGRHGVVQNATVNSSRLAILAFLGWIRRLALIFSFNEIPAAGEDLQAVHFGRNNPLRSKCENAQITNSQREISADVRIARVLVARMSRNKRLLAPIPTC